MQPVSVRFASAGWIGLTEKSFSTFIEVNGGRTAVMDRGFTVATVGADGGYSVVAFDTWGEDDAGDRLQAHLEAAPEGEVLILIIRDDGTHKLTDGAKAAITALGGIQVGSVAYNDAYALMARKPSAGTPPAAMFEAISRRDAGVNAVAHEGFFLAPVTEEEEAEEEAEADPRAAASLRADLDYARADVASLKAQLAETQASLEALQG